MWSEAGKRAGFVIALCLTVGLVGYAWYVRSDVHTYLGARKLPEWKWWYAVPRPLPNTDDFGPAGTKLSYFGYEFKVPWKRIQKQWGDGTIIHVLFAANQDLTFVNPSRWQGRFLFSDVPADLRYETLSSILSATPADMCPLRSRPHFRRGWDLVQKKAIFLGHGGPFQIFTVDLNRFRGFEIIAANGASIVFFDRGGREFSIAVSTGPGDQPRITQANIKQILQTFSPAPPDGPRDDFGP